MIQQLTTITLDSFLLLRRDKIFIPAIVGGIAIAVIANLASDWSIESFDKILFDIGTFGYHLIGSIVAILWGTKIIADAKSEGAIEAQLAAPISRTVWIVGKFLGLFLSLFFLSIILLSIWQSVMLINNFGVLTMKHLKVFLMLNFSWYVMAAVAIFFATFTNQSIALFSTFGLWIVGLSSGMVRATLSPETSATSKIIVEQLSVFWNLQKFNFSNRIVGEADISNVEIFWNATYGISVIFFILIFAGIIFRKRDLVN